MLPSISATADDQTDRHIHFRQDRPSTYQTIIFFSVCCRWLFFFFIYIWTHLIFYIYKSKRLLPVHISDPFFPEFPSLSSLAIDLWRTNGAKAKWWRLVGNLSIRNRRDTERENLVSKGNGRGGGESMSSPSYILSPSSSYTFICVHHYRLNSHKVSFVCAVCWGGIDLLCYTRLIYSSIVQHA